MTHDPLCKNLPQDRTQYGVAGNVAESVAGNVASTDAFQHDPLCEWAECVCPRDYDVPERGHLVHCPDQYCECDFIAKVRADELRRPSEDGWMSVRAVLEWDERIRADEREESIRRVTALWNRTREDEGDTPLLSDVKKVIRGDKT